KLSEDELNDFSKKFIEANDHLYRKEISKEKEADGKKVFSIEYGEVQYPQEEKESNVAYLTRLFGLYKKGWAVKMARYIYPSSEALGSFSKNLQMQIANTLSFGNTLTEALRGIASPFTQMADFYKNIAPHIKDANPVRPVFQETKMPHIPLPRNYQLEMLKELSGKMEISNEHAEELVAFIVQMNATQTAIAAELKQSGNSAKRFSAWSLIISLIVVFLTIYSIYSGSQATNKQNDLMKRASVDAATGAKEANGISRELLNATNENSKNIVNILKENNSKVSGLIEQFKKSQTDQIEQYGRILSLQAKIVSDFQENASPNSAKSTGKRLNHL
ncbi:MAG: hypothetical protein WCP55_16710, partial [Lentisphaerota bacterium]